MRKAVLAAIACTALSATASRAEDFAECRVRCDGIFTYCINRPVAREPEVEAARTADCNQKLDLCYAECERLRPVPSEMTPESNPNIIR